MASFWKRNGLWQAQVRSRKISAASKSLNKNIKSLSGGFVSSAANVNSFKKITIKKPKKNFFRINPIHNVPDNFLLELHLVVLCIARNSRQIKHLFLYP